MEFCQLRARARRRILRQEHSWRTPWLPPEWRVQLTLLDFQLPERWANNQVVFSAVDLRGRVICYIAEKMDTEARCLERRMGEWWRGEETGPDRSHWARCCGTAQAVVSTLASVLRDTENHHRHVVLSPPRCPFPSLLPLIFHPPSVPPTTTPSPTSWCHLPMPACELVGALLMGRDWKTTQTT